MTCSGSKADCWSSSLACLAFPEFAAYAGGCRTWAAWPRLEAAEAEASAAAAAAAVSPNEAGSETVPWAMGMTVTQTSGLYHWKDIENRP